SLTWNNGIVLNRTYDQDYQLTAQQVGTWQSQYSHDANGNITAHAHSLFGSINYRYDALDRLTMEEAGLRKTYTYDANGNRTSRTTAHTSLGITYFQHRLRYAPDSNRLLQSDSLYEAEVDAAGNYTRHTLSKRYQYDDQGRLSNVIDQRGNGVARYTYNALGQRVLKEARQGTNRLPFTYLYGPDGQVMGQVRYTTAGRKSKASYYVWLDSLPIAQIDLTYSAGTTVTSTTLTYLHSDHLNTPRLATNQSGNLVWSWQSDAFGIGQPKTHGSTIDVILRFPGQIADAHSGLYYNYFRDYDPETGRYVESDPIGLDGGLNTYGYVEANPLVYIDPTGENSIVGGAAAGAAVGVGAASLLCAISPNHPSCEAMRDIAERCIAYFKDKGNKEHTKGARNSTKGKHEKGRARNKRDRGGEKGDANRPYQR
ncbi:RHS repeat domain-containing protein, partial [Metapseudomonas otitidis]|uniref:RHS repeat domain-containing protein n=1 Tax=Metapseudomonas otitidis TaxID=319939 RepID=UPI0023FA4475